MAFLKTTLRKSKFIIIAVLFSGLVGCSNNPKQTENTVPELNSLTETEITEGWTLLFDGESFEGWRGLGRDDIPEAHWLIEDDCIRKVESGIIPVQADGQPIGGGDIMTTRTYSDYDFTFEWKISEAGNSGIKYNVSEEMSTWNGSSHGLGFEYQVLDDANHPDNQNPTHLSASLYDLITAENVVLKPVGEFNTGRILFNKNHCEHWLNGVMVVEFDLETPHFDSLFQKSKYTNHPDFPEKRSGHIVLQDHSDDVWYRNLKIRELK